MANDKEAMERRVMDGMEEYWEKMANKMNVKMRS